MTSAATDGTPTPEPVPDDLAAAAEQHRRKQDVTPAPEPVTGEAELPDITTPLTGDVTPDDITAMAERFIAAAAVKRDRAGRAEAEAARVRAEAHERAQAIIAAAEEIARPLDRSAAADKAEAPTLAEFGRVLGCDVGTAANARQADQADARVAQLTAERKQLAARLGEIAAEVASLAARRREADARLAEADESGDLDMTAGQMARAGAIDRRTAKLGRDRASVLARLDQIGTGEHLPGIHPQKELYAAITQASCLHGEVRRSLNWVQPHRPEAIADARRKEFGAIMDAQRERTAGEQAAAARGQQRTTVLSGPNGQTVVTR